MGVRIGDSRDQPLAVTGRRDGRIAFDSKADAMGDAAIDVDPIKPGPRTIGFSRRVK
jgi:hypothetical protein